METLARLYLSLLQGKKLPELLALFSEVATVVSPVYGKLGAKEFYSRLMADTEKSVLQLDGIFTEKDHNRLALLFDYHWTLANGQKVVFKVVDIMEFDRDLKIEKLTIIYDTVVSRQLVKRLNEERQS